MRRPQKRRGEALASAEGEQGAGDVGGQCNPGREEVLGQGDHGGSGRSGRDEAGLVRNRHDLRLGALAVGVRGVEAG